MIATFIPKVCPRVAVIINWPLSASLFYALLSAKDGAGMTNIFSQVRIISKQAVDELVTDFASYLVANNLKYTDLHIVSPSSSVGSGSM